MKKNSFLKNVLMLLFSQAIIKVIGIVYKLYLTNKTGYADTGNAIFSAAFQVYAIFLTVCSIGIPNAIASLISAKFAVGDNNGAYRVLKVSIAIFGTIGFIGSCALYFFSDAIAELYLEMPETKLVLKVLAPSIFIVAIESVLKGYFNGKGKMDVTAKSLSIEQLAKTIITIILVEILSYISKESTIIMVCGVALTNGIGSIINVLYLYGNYLKSRREIWADIITSKQYKKERKRNIIKSILRVSFPITICALIASINKTIDAFTIVKFTKTYLGETEAVRQYGILSGKVESLIAMPFSFNMAIATTLIPTISGYKARGDCAKAKSILKLSILAGILIAIPCFIVLYLFPKQILQILFPNASSGDMLLKFSSISIVIAVVIQTINSYLQGMNKMKIPIIIIGISSCIKLILNIILIQNSKIGIYGAIISNTVSYLITLAALVIYLVTFEKIHFEMGTFLIKPTIIIITIGIVMKKIYKIHILKMDLFNLLLTVCIGMLVYIGMTVILKLVKKEEIKLITEKTVNIRPKNRRK